VETPQVPPNRKEAAKKTVPMPRLLLNPARGGKPMAAAARFIQQDLEIEFIQEPWTVNDPKTVNMYSANDERPRAANTKISYFPQTKFISRDLAAAIIEVPTKKRDTKDSRWGSQFLLRG
jgi:hypothetical protein